MSISAAIRAILIADSTVLGLVGQKIYPGLIPDSYDMPAISFERDDDQRHQGLSGYLGGSEATYAVSCWSGDYDEAESVGDAVILALEDYSGTSASVAIQHIHIIDSDDEIHRAPANQPLTRYGRIVTIGVFIK